jgi:hypothetical protein
LSLIRDHLPLAVCAAIALVFAGCRTAEQQTLAFESGAASALRIAVAPMNLAVPLSPDLEDAVEPVSDELIRYLQAAGFRVAVIWLPDASMLWRDSAAALQREGEDAPEFAEVASVFSRLLAREAEFDLLLLPSLVFREAEVHGRFAQWDGVRRRIRFREGSVVPRGRAQAFPDPFDATDRSASGPVTPEWRGRITGLSVHALLFAPQGHAVFQGLGGLDLVHDAVRSSTGSGVESTLRLQARILEDAEHLREGIELALRPYLAGNPAR